MGAQEEEEEEEEERNLTWLRYSDLAGPFKLALETALRRVQRRTTLKQFVFVADLH